GTGSRRIGGTDLRSALQNTLSVPAAVTAIADPRALAALLTVDTNYGRWHENVEMKDNEFIISDRRIPYFNVASGLPDWGALGIDLVIDCTGRGTTRAGAQPHLDRGAKRVLISAPSK